MQAAGAGQIWATVIGLGVALTIVFLRNRKPRKLRIELLWIRPILFSLIIAAAIWSSKAPIGAISVALFFGAVVVGAALGWQRGRFMTIDVDPETHAITAQASPIGMIFIVGILGLRMALRGLAFESRPALGLPAGAVTDALVLLVGGMVVTQSLEMWLRARRLLDEARRAKAARQDGEGREPLVT